jgi:hypothetical protein
MFPDTVDRVERNSPNAANSSIQDAIYESVRWHADHPTCIPSRLRALDEEWDVERTLEANAATLALAGVILGAAVDRRWLVLPGLVTTFLLQHAVQGWCPPLPVLRALGVRTAREIETERSALKALRGDFSRVKEAADRPEAALRAAVLD